MNGILERIYDNIIEIRRYLHSIPELGFNELKTSKYIKEQLKSFGFDIHSVAKTGVIGFRKGDSDKGAIAFRADMDGLKIIERTNLTFASKEKGMMHACGHDGHMTILLGLAMYLSQIQNLNRDIVLIFQPAEEGPGGAKPIIDAGVFEKYNIEKVFGLHILPDIEEGKIGCKPGALMAQTGEFDIIINAKSGHGAMPHTAIDGIYVASQLISNYQSIISRNIEPIEGAVLSIGKIEGGKARNIIADNVRLEGTIRAFASNVYQNIKSRMHEINKGLERMFNVEINMEIRDMYPAVINDNELFKVFYELLDKDEMVNIKPMMIAEDFSYYQQVVPGLFFMLGSRNESLGYVHPLHSRYFNFNEGILMHGIELYIKICKKFNVI